MVTFERELVGLVCGHALFSETTGLNRIFHQAFFVHASFSSECLERTRGDDDLVEADRTYRIDLVQAARIDAVQVATGQQQVFIETFGDDQCIFDIELRQPGCQSLSWAPTPSNESTTIRRS